MNQVVELLRVLATMDPKLATIFTVALGFLALIINAG